MSSRGVNKVILVGNLGQDPEVRYIPNGSAVATLSLATSESWRDKQSGDQKEVTEWHRVVIFGKLAEIAGEYLRKGSQVYIEGHLRTRKWTDQAGADHYTTEIVADELKMLGKRPEGLQGELERLHAARASCSRRSTTRSSAACAAGSIATPVVS